MFKNTAEKILFWIKKSIITLVALSLFNAPLYALEIKLPVTSKYLSRDNFNIGLLKLLLSKIPGEHKISSTVLQYTQARVVKELKKGESINLYWMGTSPELERDLLPVYFPIYRGLLGHRVLIIHKNDKSSFDHITSLDDLSNYVGVQGIGWSDIKILEHAKLKQKQAVYENIFSLMNRGRYDYFSRGINEAYREVASRQSAMPNLYIDENILLVYPFAFYLFTNPENEELARLLTQAFNQAYDDGSFLDYFYKHSETLETFKLMNIKKRVRYDIANPFLTSRTKAIAARYWH
ncbi:MAG: hypothetical protein MJK10_15800 [Pseudomonadales bacterium]|nr:hypothetical protein [Pseudomonadales bacterium]NRA17531.1 hypothetical protein [Oceanospirillaceae bacterium]